MGNFRACEVCGETYDADVAENDINCRGCSVQHAPQWVPVGERRPPAGVVVLASDGARVWTMAAEMVRGHRSATHWGLLPGPPT